MPLIIPSQYMSEEISTTESNSEYSSESNSESDEKIIIKNKYPFTNYIDFRNLINTECLDDDNIFIGMKSKVYKEYCDAKINSKLSRSGAKVFSDIVPEKMILLKNVYDKMPPCIKKSYFYEYRDTYLFFIVMDTEFDNCLEMFGAINDEPEKYTFLGNIGSHPFIVSNYFRYDNSDGSGPNIIGDLRKDYSANNILQVMKRYYDSFCGNSYH